MLLGLAVVCLFANLSLPEAFELVAGVPAEDLSADVLAVHPLKKKRGTEALPGMISGILAGYRVHLNLDSAVSLWLTI